MTTLSDSEIAQYARGAGLSGDAVAIAVAIAIAESGGDPRNHNPVPPDNSYGLWQINMLGSMGPARRKQYGLSSNEDLYNPAVNARIMVSMSGGGTKWTPWTTYTRGTYKMYLSRGKAVANGGSGAPVQATQVSTTSKLTDLMTILTNGGTWRVVGWYALGSLLILMGLVLLAKGELLNVAKSQVGKVLP